MKRLLVNIALFFVAIILIGTIGIYGLFFGIVYSLIHYTKINFINFCADTMYAINIGIDQIGNVLLSTFLNKFCLINKLDYPFGKVDMTISHVLAINYFALNLKSFGLLIVNILEFFDNDHMNKSI